MSYNFMPRGMSREMACYYLGINEMTFDELLNKGNIPQPFKLGGQKLWDVNDLDDAFNVMFHKTPPEEKAPETPPEETPGPKPRKSRTATEKAK